MFLSIWNEKESPEGEKGEIMYADNFKGKQKRTLGAHGRGCCLHQREYISGQERAKKQAWKYGNVRAEKSYAEVGLVGIIYYEFFPTDLWGERKMECCVGGTIF